MNASQPVRESDFESHKIAHRFDTVATPVDIIAEEKKVVQWTLSRDPKHFQHIIKLSAHMREHDSTHGTHKTSPQDEAKFKGGLVLWPVHPQPN